MTRLGGKAVISGQLCAISPLSTGLRPKIPLCATRKGAHIQRVIGTEVPASLGRKGRKVRSPPAGDGCADRRRTAPRGDGATKRKSGPVGRRRRKSRSRLCEGGFPPREAKPREGGQPKKGRGISGCGGSRAKAKQHREASHPSGWGDERSSEDPRIRLGWKRRLSW